MLTDLILIQQNALANVVRILIYKEDASILEKVNLEDDQIFLEPLLMAYFNRAQIEKEFPKGMLSPLMQGFFLEKENIAIEALCNHDGIAYVPKKGYYKKGETTPFEDIYIIPETTIEVLKYEVPLLRNVVHIVSQSDPFQEEQLFMDSTLFEHNATPLTNALHHIKEYNPEFYSFIELCIKKCTFYKTKGVFSRSFASINANGNLFLSISDEKDAEDEVYFLDMLGYFTGKVMHTTLMHKQEEIFKINHRTRIATIIETDDHRNIYTICNNAFSTIAACLCLESGLDANKFTMAQQQDAKVRMALYLKKYESDLQKLEAAIAHFSGLENIFVDNGITIYNFMLSHGNRLMETYIHIHQNFDFSGFHYRMDYAEFSKNNL